jgi:hypothetical protein
MGISERTAVRDLRQLTDLGIFTKIGSTGQPAHYIIVKAKLGKIKKGGEPVMNPLNPPKTGIWRYTESQKAAIKEVYGSFQNMENKRANWAMNIF